MVETCTSLPYGDNLSCIGTDVSPLHFTGQMRDTETGLDDFPARYYSSTQGRWYSPDWASAQVPVPYADLHNPQTLNLYDYVGSDPTNHYAPGQEANNACAGNQQCAENKQAQAEAQTAAQNATPAPQPAPTDPKGNPTPPPVPVPGAPEGTGWKWNPDPQNPRGGTWGPDEWKGPNPPRGSWDPNGHWDVDKGD